MNFILGLIILLINIYFLIKDSEKGLFFFLLCSLFSPNVHIVSNIISYNIFAFFPVFVLFVLKQKRIKINSYLIGFFIYLIILLIASFVSMYRYKVIISYIEYFGHFRFLINLFLFYYLFKINSNSFKKILLIGMAINIIVVVVQLTIPDSVYFFYQLYYKPSLTPLNYVVRAKRFTRAYGTFGSPVQLGYFSLIAFSYFYSQILKNKKTLSNYIVLFIALICGLLALSKTFLLGAPLIIIIGWLVYKFINGVKFNVKRKFINRLILIVAALIIIFIISYQIALIYNLPVKTYVNMITNPFKSFVTRYDTSGGILRNTYEVILNNIVFGVGTTKINNEFLGDSLYITLLHETGIIGLFMVLIIFYKIFIDNFNNENISNLILLIVIIISGFALPNLFSIFGALVFGKLINNKFTKQNSNEPDKIKSNC